MKLLFVLNYYYPYISGISEGVRLLAEKLAKDPNNKITVLCSNHNKLPAKEIINSVQVIRAPIWMKISKGTVSPAFIRYAKKLSKNADVVNLHAPMLESGIISHLINTKKLILTYHCDINLSSSLIDRFIVKVMDISHNAAFKRAKKVIFTSIDYAKSSRVAKNYISKAVSIAPIYKEITPIKCKRIKNSIGFCGRIVEEKGINVLLKAFEIIKKQLPDAKLRIAGDYINIAGGSVYPELNKYIKDRNIEDVTFLGKIKEENLAKFYSELDVFVLPSINSLEAFGLVQLEAMLCGTPVVASDLPGVRTIVSNTNMGRIAKRNNAKDLAKQILEVINNRKNYEIPRSEILKIYSNDVLIQQFINEYEEICKG